MKKNRPATKISVICNECDLDKFIECILKETTTFGVRYKSYDRVILNREIKEIDTEFGKIRFKFGYLDGKLIKVTPEYEDCKLKSIEHNIPLNILMNKILYTI